MTFGLVYCFIVHLSCPQLWTIYFILLFMLKVLLNTNQSIMVLSLKLWYSVLNNFVNKWD